jgi:hypothetical protein
VGHLPPPQLYDGCDKSLGSVISQELFDWEYDPSFWVMRWRHLGRESTIVVPGWVEHFDYLPVRGCSRSRSRWVNPPMRDGVDRVDERHVPTW